MRSALIFLALVPLVFSYPEKRLFLDTLGLDLGSIKATVQHILDTLGTDATEQQCEGVCHGFVKGDDGALLHTFCTPVCRSVQSLTHVFHLTPSVTSAPARRSIFDQLVDIQAVKDTVAKLADTLGTDATEQQCEAGCHAIVLGEETALAHTLCTPVCKSFQALSHHFGHHQAKRFFLDSIGLDLGSIKFTVQHLVDTLGTDATEQQCEGVCHGFVRGDDGALLHTFCTPVCRSLQSLTHVFHLTPAVTSAPARRSIFDQLVDIQAVKDTVAKLADTLGTDATEQQCEAGCHAIVLGEETALAHTLCSPVCKSFQALSHHFGHHQTKRFFLDSVGLDLGSIKSTVQHVLDTLGTDATEQQCEGVCHGFVKGDDGALLHTFCTPVCRSMQSLTHVFHLTPAVTSAPARRSIFDQLVDIQAVKDTVAKLADTLGTDATEQQCEAGCHAIVLGEETALAHTLCSPVCKSFQALSHHFGHHQAKRFFLDTFGVDLNVIKATVQHVLDTLGTDATEQQCEGVCHGFVKGDDGALLHTFCTPVCRSVQSLTHVFHLTPAVTAPARRSIFDQLVDIQAVKDTVAKLADTLGTDATEQQCEAGCHAIVLGEETALAHTLCSPVCKSFQALSHHFGHHQAKRFFLDTIGLDLGAIKDTVQHLVDNLATDANEQQCEGVCHGFVKGDDGALLHTFCTPVCKSFQSLVHMFNISPNHIVASTAAPATV